MKMKQPNNNKKIYSLLNFFKTRYKKLAFGIVATIFTITGVFVASKIIRTINETKVIQEPTSPVLSTKSTEILGVEVEKDNSAETKKPHEEINSYLPSVTPSVTPKPTSTPYLAPTQQPTPISTPTTIVIIQPTLTPTPTLMPTSQPSIYINPEIEAKLAELRETLDHIYNQPVAMNVIYGRMQRAYQDWVKDNPEIYSAILSSRYINDLNAILTAYGL